MQTSLLLWAFLSLPPLLHLHWYWQGWRKLEVIPEYWVAPHSALTAFTSFYWGWVSLVLPSSESRWWVHPHCVSEQIRAALVKWIIWSFPLTVLWFISQSSPRVHKLGFFSVKLWWKMHSSSTMNAVYLLISILNFCLRKHTQNVYGANVRSSAISVLLYKAASVVANANRANKPIAALLTSRTSVMSGGDRCVLPHVSATA